MFFFSFRWIGRTSPEDIERRQSLEIKQALDDIAPTSRGQCLSDPVKVRYRQDSEEYGVELHKAGWLGLSSKCKKIIV